MAPAAIRNAIVAHQWSFVSSHGGLNFYIGNRETATGFYQPVPGITPTISGQEKDARVVAERALGHPVTRRRGVGLLLRPLARVDDRASGRRRRRSSRGSSITPSTRSHVALPHSYPFYAHDAGTALRFYAIGPWLLIPLGLVGLVLAGSGTSASEYLVWCLLRPGVCGGGRAVLRRRAVPPAAARPALRRRRRRDRSRDARRAAARRWTMRWRVAARRRAVLAVAANWPLHVDEGRWLEGLRTAQQLVILAALRRGRSLGDAARRAADHGPPRPGAGRYGVGAQLLAVNQPQRALLYLDAAHHADPSDAHVEYALGQALLKPAARRRPCRICSAASTPASSCREGGYDLRRRAAVGRRLPRRRRGDPPHQSRGERRCRGVAAAWTAGRAGAGAGRRRAVLPSRRADAARPRRRAPATRAQPARARQDSTRPPRELGGSRPARSARSRLAVAPRLLRIQARTRRRRPRPRDARRSTLNPADELAKGIIRAGGS